MKILPIFLFAFFSLLLSPVAWALQTPLNTSCNDKSKLDWHMNPEPDVDKYRVYSSNTAGITKASVVLMEVDHDPSKVVFDRQGKGHFSQGLNSTLAEGPKYFALTAVDAQGNESDLSIEAGCQLTIVPGAPVNFLIVKISLSTFNRPSFGQ